MAEIRAEEQKEEEVEEGSCFPKLLAPKRIVSCSRGRCTETRENAFNPFKTLTPLLLFLLSCHHRHPSILIDTEGLLLLLRGLRREEERILAVFVEDE